jgi:hypothetical protein
MPPYMPRCTQTQSQQKLSSFRRSSVTSVVYLTFSDVKVTLPVKTKTGTGKVLIDSITAHAVSGRVLALMGPSGMQQHCTHCYHYCIMYTMFTVKYSGKLCRAHKLYGCMDALRSSTAAHCIEQGTDATTALHLHCSASMLYNCLIILTVNRHKLAVI